MNYQAFSALTVIMLTARIIYAQGLPGLTLAESLPLYYDARTGNATIDTTNVFLGEMAGYSWRVPCEEPCSWFNSDAYTPFMNTLFVTSTVDRLGETNFAGLPGGVYSLGAVLPEGLSEQQLTSNYFPSDENDSRYYVISATGSRTQHLLEPIYSPSPFPAINDSSVGPASAVTQWATEAALEYNALTGELSLDTTGPSGGAIFSYDIKLNEDLFDTDSFRPAYTSEFAAPSVEEDRIVEVGWDGIPAGNHNMGTVLPAGLSEDDLFSIVAQARFLGEPGHDVASFSVESSGIDMKLQHVIVPEPGASLFCYAFLAILVATRTLIAVKLAPEL